MCGNSLGLALTPPTMRGTASMAQVLTFVLTGLNRRTGDSSSLYTYFAYSLHSAKSIPHQRDTPIIHLLMSYVASRIRSEIREHNCHTLFRLLSDFRLRFSCHLAVSIQTILPKVLCTKCLKILATAI
jgi:hypothetical protein